jgi:hypothetical protein
MMRYLLIISLFLQVLLVQAQHTNHPQRTVEDIARKQTEMLVRELGIKDSITRERIFHLHLKFARKRQVSNTRAEALQYIQEANAELQQILTPEQYEQFMHQQINHNPHRPHNPCNRIVRHVEHTTPSTLSEHGEEEHTQIEPSANQQ